MRYNTGNPVEPDGSSSPFDLHDNAGNIDLIANGEAPSYPDRRGRPRKSIAGMESDFQSAQDQRRAQFEAMQALQAQQFEMAQDIRVNEFNEFILSSGYETPVDYAPGLIITRLTQVVRHNGELYRPKDSAIPFTTTTFVNDEAKWVANGDNSLRQDLAQGDGSMIGFKSPISGAVKTNLALLGADWVDIRAVFGAIGDGQYHPLSEEHGSLAAAQFAYPTAGITSVTQSIDWAAAQSVVAAGRVGYMPRGQYVWTDRVRTPRGSGLVGENSDSWVAGFTGMFFGGGGTIILMYGRGAKTNAVKHISANAAQGAVVVNPSSGVAHYAAANTVATTYEMLELTNRDAVGATPATPKAFSVAIDIESGGGDVRLEHFRILPWYDGMEGYRDPMRTGLGDEWDVGILIRGCGNNYINNVSVVGYWRLAALLKPAVSEAWNVPRNNESDHFHRCKFQGHTGISLRAYDVHKVVAKTSNTISIPWVSTHCFEAPSLLVTAAGQFNYSAVTFDAVNNLLVFTVEQDTGAVTIGGYLTEYGTTFGTSGTVFDDCQVTDLAHTSRMCSTNTLLDEPFAVMGKALEIGGEQTRAFQFINCTFTARDDILVFQTRSKDAMFTDCYFESSQAYAAPGSGNVLPAGGRWIAIQQGAGGIPTSGGTENLRVSGGTITQMVDMRPFAGTASTNRFTGAGDSGLFRPYSGVIDSYMRPEAQNGDAAFRSNSDVTLTCGPTQQGTGAPGSFAFTRNGGGDVTIRGRSPNLDLAGVQRVRLGTTTGDGVTKVIGFTADAGVFYPSTDGDKDLGTATLRFDEAFINRLRISTASILSGNGSPEGNVTAGIGSIYLRLDGSGTTPIWYGKTTSSGNTGWVPK